LSDSAICALRCSFGWSMTRVKGIEQHDFQRLGLDWGIARACSSPAFPYRLALLPCERRAGGRAGQMPEDAGIRQPGLQARSMALTNRDVLVNF